MCLSTVSNHRQMHCLFEKKNTDFKKQKCSIFNLEKLHGKLLTNLHFRCIIFFFFVHVASGTIMQKVGEFC